MTVVHLADLLMPITGAVACGAVATREESLTKSSSFAMVDCPKCWAAIYRKSSVPSDKQVNAQTGGA